MSTRTEEAATSALRGWADGVQALAGAQNALADMPDLWARSFGALRTVLAAQRQLADALVRAAQTAQSVTDQATRTAEHALDALQAASSSVAGLAAVGAEQAESAARLARSTRH